MAPFFCMQISKGTVPFKHLDATEFFLDHISH